MYADSDAAVWCDFEMFPQLLVGNCRCNYVRFTQYLIRLMHS
jgi:hypothetical protein